MTLLATCGSLTQPGATGNQDTDLTAIDSAWTGVTPKAIIMWATPVASAGTAAHSVFCIGYGTYRSSTVAHVHSGFAGEDGIGGFDNERREQNTDALLKLLAPSGGGSTVDCEIDLVSFTSGTFTVNWINLHATASIKVNYLVLGGDEITDALAGTFTPSGTTQDVTVVSGFGQPDLLFFASHTGMSTSDGLDYSLFSTGFAKRGESGRCLAYSVDANTSSGARAAFQGMYNNKALACYGVAGSQAGDAQIMTLNATGGWPVNGFEVGWHATLTDPGDVMYLALKGTFNVTTGEATTPTSTGDVNLNHGAVPKAAMVYHARTATANTQDASSADDASVGVGALDGTREVWAGAFNDDAATTTQCNSGWTNTKSFRSYSPATPTLESEADGSISGNNAVLSFTDAEASTAYLIEWVTIGSSVTGTTVVSPAATALADAPIPLLTARAPGWIDVTVR